MAASSWLRLLALPALGLVLGCAGASNPGRGDGPSPGADLAGQPGRDLAQPPGLDLAVRPGADLAGAGPDLAVSPDGAGGDGAAGDLAEAPDLLPMGKGPGEYCDQDGECGARLCKAIIPGFKKVSVTPCKVQNDCNFNDLFCHPTKAGAADGYCVPRSSMHCSSCS